MKASFKLLFNNDTSNIACPRLGYVRGEPATAGLLEASIDEVTGTQVDAIMLSYNRAKK